jgi:thiol:disulfide interchange protein
MRLVAVRLVVVLTVLTMWAVAAFAAAPTPPSPLVRVELLSEAQSVRPGETFWVALRQQIHPGWHTYWGVNPGDAGEPTRVEWSLPAGFTAGEIAWPYPARFPVGIAMSYGYEHEVVLPIPLTAPRDAAPGTTVALRGQASWLVCEKVCVPEETPIALSLPVASEAPRPDPRGAARIAEARRRVPAASPWPASFTATAETVTLTVAATELAPERVAEVWFYPARWGAIDHAAPQAARLEPGRITLEVKRGQLAEATGAPLDGVLVVAERLDGGVARQAFALRAEPHSGSAALAVVRAMALALLGGLVLNLMPCVLPVLSVKTLALVRHEGGGALRRHGLAYTAGVLASFALVAGALLALRAGGEQIGWGFQLQSPVVVTVLAFVLFAVALNLSGVFAVSGRFAGAGQALAGRTGYAGSFFTGALATVAATPCTAPFMGAAVGYAVTQRWTTALLVFEALALGLALPFLLLTLIPAWRRFLPAPGPWMERLKQALAFPLYASVAWLVWVVSQQTGSAGVAAALGGLVLIAFAAWLYESSRGARVTWRRAATIAVAALVVGAVALGPLTGAVSSAPSPAKAADGWEPFSASRLSDLRAAGRPVFVNITAAWCLTCLVNERVALRAPAVTAALARKDVATLKADWTSRDPAITRVLGSFGRSGVPLYLLYPARGEGEPAVLPQILSEGAVIDALDKL